MRKLEEVIKQMLAVIPVEGHDLRVILQANKDSVMFSAPELLPLRWKNVAQELEDYFCEEVNGVVQAPKFEPGSWQEKVFNIWMDK